MPHRVVAVDQLLLAEVEEALRPLDGHRTVTGARIVHINLVGPQVSLPLYWVPANRRSIHFFVRNKEALPCGRRGPSCQPLQV